MFTVMMKGTALIISRRKGILRICSQIFPFKEKEKKNHVTVGLRLVLMRNICDILMPLIDSLPLTEFQEAHSFEI